MERSRGGGTVQSGRLKGTLPRPAPPPDAELYRPAKDDRLRKSRRFCRFVSRAALAPLRGRQVRPGPDAGRIVCILRYADATFPAHRIEAIETVDNASPAPIGKHHNGGRKVWDKFAKYGFNPVNA